MKSEMIENKTEDIGFPRLQIEVGSGTVYLMKDAVLGTRVYVPESSGLLLALSDSCSPLDMQDFDGAIMLSND